jgi:hypothetical protein
MSFWKRTQAERDADFLAAVGAHKFAKAEKLVRKGANPLATDTEGNTAFHKMTSAYYIKSSSVEDFICFLLKQKLDINARNKQGHTCLHLVGISDHPDEKYDSLGYEYTRCTGGEMLGYLMNRGARITDKDDAGRTVVHIAALSGLKEFIDVCLKIHSSLIAVQDNEGRYPHDSAVAGVVPHHNLAALIKKKFDAYQAPAVEKKPIVTEAPVAKSADTDWILLKPDQVAHVSVEKTIGYKLTEIFNFSSRTYARITHNLETRADVSETRGFDDFSDKSAFAAARQELLRLGGQADESSVHGQVLDKKRPSLSKDA